MQVKDFKLRLYKNFGIYPIILTICAMLFASSCTRDSDIEIPAEPEHWQAKNFGGEVALEWMQLYLELERYMPGYRPPVSARALAYLGMAGYEATLPGMTPEYNSIADHFPGLELPKYTAGKTYHWPTATNAAYADMLLHLFINATPARKKAILDLREKNALKFGSQLSLDIAQRSEIFGSEIALAIFEWSRTDIEGHEAYLRNTDPNYIPPIFDGSWQPTGPNYLPALLPHWGKVRTFAADTGDHVGPPIPYDTDTGSPFYEQALECMTLVNQIRSGTNPEDAWIADFWSDDCPGLTFTPAARWIAIANQIVESEDVTLDIAVYTYAKVGMALNDAGVNCWNDKYKYNLLRPVDYISTVMGASDWQTLMCPDGSGTYTPSFPAYPSGHATFGAAAAEVLTNIYNISHGMTDRCHEGRIEFLSSPRSFQNFYEMAVENAYSRIPLGVHYRMDAEAGLTLGYHIGKKVNDLHWKN